MPAYIQQEFCMFIIFPLMITCSITHNIIVKIDALLIGLRALSFIFLYLFLVDIVTILYYHSNSPTLSYIIAYFFLSFNYYCLNNRVQGYHQVVTSTIVQSMMPYRREWATEDLMTFVLGREYQRVKLYCLLYIWGQDDMK